MSSSLHSIELWELIGISNAGNTRVAAVCGRRCGHGGRFGTRVNVVANCKRAKRTDRAGTGPS